MVLELGKARYNGFMGKGDDMKDDFLLMSYDSHKQLTICSMTGLEARGLPKMSSNGKGWSVDVKGMWLSRA